MPGIDQHGLGAAQVEHFIERGYLKLDGAFGTDLAGEARDILWKAMGLSPDEPERWTKPVIRLPFMAAPPFVTAANAPVLHAAYDALVGVDRWIAPAGLGTFPVRFPSPDDPGDAGWHVDMSFGTDNADFMQWRVNVRSRGRAMLMLFLFSDVTEDDGPTKTRAGSHFDIAQQLLPRGEDGMTLGELAADGFASTSHCDEALATGEAGSVYLCHPFLVHSAQPNRAGSPRFMAQPTLLPKTDFDPALPPSPVQLAIRRACGL